MSEDKTFLIMFDSVSHAKIRNYSSAGIGDLPLRIAREKET